MLMGQCASLRAHDIESAVHIVCIESMLTKPKGPLKHEIRHVRTSLGLTQQQSAAMVGLSHGSRWAEFESGTRKIDPGRWELFLLKVGQHPGFTISQRAINYPVLRKVAE